MIYILTHLLKPAVLVIPQNNIIRLSVYGSIFLVQFPKKILVKVKWPSLWQAVQCDLGLYSLFMNSKLFQFNSSSLPKHFNLLARQSALLWLGHFLTFHTLYPVSLSRLDWPGTHCKPVQPWVHSLPTLWDCRTAPEVSSTTFIDATKSKLSHFGHLGGHLKTCFCCCFFQGNI